MADLAPIPEDRPLTQQEQAVVRWLLEHGSPDAAGYLPQLTQSRVVSRCPCGCASIDFAISGVIPPADAGMNVLSDYIWQADDGALCGIFVFSSSGLLAGLEVWSADGGMGAVSTLPSVELLRPLAALSAEPNGPATSGGS